VKFEQKRSGQALIDELPKSVVPVSVRRWNGGG